MTAPWYGQQTPHYPRDPPAPDKRQTALFSHLDKNTVIAQKASGYHVIVLVFLSTVAIYRVFHNSEIFTVFTSHNDLSFFNLTSVL